jgi:hypothetical protein
VARSAVFITLLLFTSCRDEAAETFARAELAHHALLAQAARPEDPRFDAVIGDLRSVPSSSKHFTSAQKLIQAIEAGRRHPVRTPLALAANGRRPPQLEAQLAACARLAAMAGADGGVDQRVMVALEACRLSAEKMELRFSHPEEFDGGGE